MSRSRIAALTCLAGFFLPWAGLGPLTFSGYQLASLNFEGRLYGYALALAAIPMLAFIGFATNRLLWHRATGLYTVTFLLLLLIESLDGLALEQLPSATNLSELIKLIKIGLPLTFGGAIAQWLCDDSDQMGWDLRKREQLAPVLVVAGILTISGSLILLHPDIDAQESACPWSLMGCGDDGSSQVTEGAGGAIQSEDRFGSTDNSKGIPYGYFTLLLLILTTGGLMLYFTKQAQQGKKMFIRRMPGIDAIEDGIGRATEMGKPVLYVPGIDDLQDIQTIASMLILGQVSKTIAEYQCDLIVSCCVPIVREVADEVVRAGFYQAGYPDAFRPEQIRFIASEQFAFCAGTNGIMLREKPATNIYLGRFFAESLILAETGYLNRSIQIAGTAEATQLPFFVAACDYTLIGEELFAVSAYLSRDPRLVSSLKASDYLKVAVVITLLVGTIMVGCGNYLLVDLFSLTPGDDHSVVTGDDDDSAAAGDDDDSAAAGDDDDSAAAGDDDDSAVRGK